MSASADRRAVKDRTTRLRDESRSTDSAGSRKVRLQCFDFALSANKQPGEGRTCKHTCSGCTLSTPVSSARIETTAKWSVQSPVVRWFANLTL